MKNPHDPIVDNRHAHPLFITVQPALAQVCITKTFCATAKRQVNDASDAVAQKAKVIARRGALPR
ncbi:hypothetical protein AQU20_01315 [Escherichia albertii]|nr:hypothetical protein AQU20_01315 [Escherichia albertii]